MADCIFCDILAGRLPASFTYRGEVCSVFMDIQPVNPGHVLVVPNQHAAYLADLEPETGWHMFQVAQRMAAALRRSGVKCEGVNLFLADGEAAMQEVFHAHLHVFPRYTGDGFGLTFGLNYFNRPPRDELDRVAALVRDAL
ncbi:MAG: HIT family protein [Anaerolineales bacterium]